PARLDGAALGVAHEQSDFISTRDFGIDDPEVLNGRSRDPREQSSPIHARSKKMQVANHVPLPIEGSREKRKHTDGHKGRPGKVDISLEHELASEVTIDSLQLGGGADAVGVSRGSL